MRGRQAQRPDTQFAPPDRAPARAVESQAQAVESLGFTVGVLDAVMDVVIVLNQQRQIVFYNRALSDLLGVPSRTALLGLRPGEALGCVHARRMVAGCGTSEFCAACGAVLAILSSLRQTPDVQECRIQREDGADPLELLVRATPLEVDGEAFSVVAARDISHEKRRRTLERVFFHDLLNTVTGLQMMASRLGRARGDERDRLEGQVRQAVERLMEEIAAQRDLVAAESGRLPVRPACVEARALLEEAVRTHGADRDGSGRAVRIDPASEACRFTTDPLLATRVLGNMIRNAVEACEPGRSATAGCRRASDGSVEFWVNNPGEMPREVRLQVFQRSFSTKGEDRGLGTYSMKLLTERYLKGRVEFTSDAEAGTTFRAIYPLEIG